MTIKFEDMGEERDSIVGLHLSGGCIAVAAQRRTGWPAVQVATSTGGFAHCGLRSPDGLIFDARGFQSEDDFAAQYTGDVLDADLAELARIYPYSKHYIGRLAETHLQILFPDFPGKHVDAEPLDAFARDLHALCQKHGVYLRSNLPNGITLYPAYGDETGFDITLGAMGVTIDRALSFDADDEPVNAPAP